MTDSTAQLLLEDAESTHAGVGSPVRPPRWGRISVSPAVYRGVLGVIALGVILQIVSSSSLVDRKFVPEFTTVLSTSWHLMGNGTFLSDLASTVESTFVGLAVSTVIGVVFGVAFGVSETLYRMFRVFVEALRPIPPVAFIPIAILAFGTGLEMKSFLVAMVALWPVLLNTMYAIRNTDQAKVAMAQSYRVPRARIMFSVTIPGALPLMFAGIRLAASLSLMVVVAVELLTGGAEGLGAFIASAQALGNETVDVYAGAFIAGCLGLLINVLFDVIEGLFLSNYQPGR